MWALQESTLQTAWFNDSAPSQVFADQITSEDLMRMVRSCPALVYLELSGCRRINAEVYGHLVHTLPALQTLIVDRLSSAAVERMVSKGPLNLTALMVYFGIAVSSVLALTAMCPQLTLLET